MTTTRPPLWNIILAAGDGTRLASLTRRLHGDDRPKQFAVLDGSRSMLECTVERLAHVAPPERTVVVVAEKHLPWARAQTAHLPGIELIAQPRNAGTGPGVLLPLMHVLARDPDAAVVISPSDHHFRRPERFTAKLTYAREAAEVSHAGVCLLAVEAESPSPELGWILPGMSLPLRPGASTIARFIEKPDVLLARALLERGALWNTFVMVGRACAFWELATRHLPHQAFLFSHYAAALERRAGADVLRAIYADMPSADFSHDLLGQARGLAVTAVSGSGWSDWGTPQRLMESLAGTPALDHLQRRLHESSQAA
jgi:mannose-1-phosphate guanylyltransferase